MHMINDAKKFYHGVMHTIFIYTFFIYLTGTPNLYSDICMRPEIVSKCLHLNLAVLSFKLSHIIERTVKKKRRIELKNKKQERIPKAFVKKKLLIIDYYVPVITKI